MSRPPSGSHEDAAQAALRRVRREGRWWWVQAWHARRIWRWALLAAAAVFLLLVLLWVVVWTCCHGQKWISVNLVKLKLKNYRALRKSQVKTYLVIG